MRWLAQSTIYRDCVDLLLVEDDGNGRYVAEPTTFTMHLKERHAAISAPTLELPHDSAKSLMQALWDAGLRPNDGTGSGAEVSALKAHLKFAEGVATKCLDTITDRISGSRE